VVAKSLREAYGRNSTGLRHASSTASANGDPLPRTDVTRIPIEISWNLSLSRHLRSSSSPFEPGAIDLNGNEFLKCFAIFDHESRAV
jgi:hypothetical protein